jgi:hypothetical protein
MLKPNIAIGVEPENSWVFIVGSDASSNLILGIFNILNDNTVSSLSYFSVTASANTPTSIYIESAPNILYVTSNSN